MEAASTETANGRRKRRAVSGFIPSPLMLIVSGPQPAYERQIARVATSTRTDISQAEDLFIWRDLAASDLEESRLRRFGERRPGYAFGGAASSAGGCAVSPLCPIIFRNHRTSFE